MPEFLFVSTGRGHPTNLRQVPGEEGRPEGTLRQGANLLVFPGEILGQSPRHLMPIHRSFVDIHACNSILQADLNTNVEDEQGAFYGVTSQ